MADTQDLLRLADEVLAAKKSDNALDVRCEIALFEPDDFELAARPNGAGSKVILTVNGGFDRTVRARDFTITPGARRETARRLRARAHSTKESDNG